MKTRILMIAAAIAALASSCQNDITLEQVTPGTEPAVISTGAATKTSLGEDGKTVNWTSDDQIAVFDNLGGKSTFEASEVNGSYAKFSGAVLDGTTHILAVYPENLAKSANGNTLTVNIPANQTSKAGSFDEEHNISVAKADKTPGTPETSPATFKNVCALLKFTIPSYIGDATKVTISSNSVIAGDMTVDFSAEEPACSITEGSKSISMTGTFAEGSTFWFILAPVTLENIAVEVETEKGTYSMNKTATIEMTAGKYKNLGTLELQKATLASATAAHTYSNGVLTGTQVSVNLGIDQTTAAYITALALQIKNAEGTVIRTSNVEVAESVVMPAEGSWPYLPLGDYTVSGTYTLSGVTEKPIEDILFSVTEAPVFQISATVPYTSYDKYLAGDISGANDLNGSTIYNVGATVTISDAILNNENYPSLSITDNGAAVSAGNISGCSWGEHTIKASYTLDGVTAEAAEAVVEVTGLPYSHTFYKNESNTKSTWTCNNIKYTINKCAIFYDGSYGYMFSPKFNIPEGEINIFYTIGARFYMPKAFNADKETCDFYVGASSNNTTTVTTNTHTFKGSKSTDTSYDSCSGNLTLSSDVAHISLDSQDKDYSTTLNIPEYIWLHNISVTYGN